MLPIVKVVPMHQIQNYQTASDHINNPHYPILPLPPRSRLIPIYLPIKPCSHRPSASPPVALHRPAKVSLPFNINNHRLSPWQTSKVLISGLIRLHQQWHLSLLRPLTISINNKPSHHQHRRHQLPGRLHPSPSHQPCANRLSDLMHPLPSLPRIWCRNWRQTNMSQAKFIVVYGTSGAISVTSTVSSGKPVTTSRCVNTNARWTSTSATLDG